MDAMTLVSPAETERRAMAFTAEFLAPIDDIAFDLDRVSVRTVHEHDELRLTWGVSVSSLVLRARERGVLSDYPYRSMYRATQRDRPNVRAATRRRRGTPHTYQRCARTTHSGRLHHQRSGRHHPPDQHAACRAVPDHQQSTRHPPPHHGLTLLAPNMGWNSTHVRDTQWKVIYANKQSLALEQDHAAGGRENRVIPGSGALARVVLQARSWRLYAELRWQTNKTAQPRPRRSHRRQPSSQPRRWLETCPPTRPRQDHQY